MFLLAPQGSHTIFNIEATTFLTQGALVKLAFQPPAALVILAMRAASVAAGVGNIDPFAALVVRTASLHVRAMFVSAMGHGIQDLDVARQEVFPVGAAETVPEFADDRGEQHYMCPPQVSMSRESTRWLTANLALLAVPVVRWVYLLVVRRLTWPRICCSSSRSTPASSMCVA